MEEISITERFCKLAADRHHFRNDIDLFDETLREGAERSTIFPSIDEKVTLSKSIVETGIRSLVVGMFPDVPHNIELLQRLIAEQQAGNIPQQTRFLIISHVGETMDQTLAVLKNLDVPLTTVWIIAIFSVSDPQIRVLLPTIIKKSIDAQWSDDRWEKLQPTQRRAESLELLKGFLDRQLDYPKERVVVGLLDCFRADYDHVLAAVGTAVSCGVENFRLVDTAGSAFVEQVHHLVGALVTKYPQCRFFGHFHNDFGLATATALAGLSEGLAGVDVSVGGFANRAGHAPVAEVAMALRSIYGVTLEGFHYDLLTKLSRTTEQVYGLMESPTQPITGVITHGVLSGIRTQLIDKEPRIFDEIEPEEVGGHLDRVFGVRSGRDGMLRYLQDHAAEVRKLGFTANSETADELLDELTIVWSQRSEKSIAAIRALIGDYHRLLRAAAFTESEMLDWLSAHSRNQAAE